mmetsp:Transcript_29783/g.52283  ORF Transcript_29783/g.52283 Transcript_29783/m.52283 type:complete len:266 (+) Transcript_29783:741-1538(+)
MGLFSTVNASQTAQFLKNVSHINIILLDILKNVLSNNKKFQARSKKYYLPSFFMLYGPPGCGKTMIGKLIGIYTNLQFCFVKSPTLLKKYVGEGERQLSNIFAIAKKFSPSILFFDEIDAITTSRSMTSLDGNKLTHQLLIELDDLEFNRKVTVIGSTNNLEILDLALLRKGRFSKIYYIPYPTKNSLLKIFKSISLNYLIGHCIDFFLATNELFFNGFSSSDLQYFIQFINGSIKTFLLDIDKGFIYHTKLIKLCHLIEKIINL